MAAKEQMIWWKEGQPFEMAVGHPTRDAFQVVGSPGNQPSSHGQRLFKSYLIDINSGVFERGLL